MYRKSMFIAALALAAPVMTLAANITPPAVPDIIAVPQGSKAFAIVHAVGTQGYVCLPSGTAAKWVLFGPQATLFDDEGEQVMTHFLSPNPRGEQHSPRDVAALFADQRSVGREGGGVGRCGVRRARCDQVVPAARGRLSGWLGCERPAAEDHVHSPREYFRRRGSGRRMQRGGTRRSDEARPVHGGLRVLQMSGCVLHSSRRKCSTPPGR